ncbi:MAG: hypothetical protein MJZ20_06850 [Bacteroidaceae bacterium]|nr:hypothetical protein [Bacteroidaceae bacterium]
MKKSLIKKIEKEGVYLYGADKKVSVISGVDLFGKTCFTILGKKNQKKEVLSEDEYGLTFSLKPF